MDEMNQSKLSLDCLRLYGREDEVASLKDAYYKSLKSSSCRIVWIHGYGGVGKTTLVQTVFQDEDYYCRGKFERIRTAQPYSAIITLLSRLCLILEFGFPTIPVSAEVAAILANILPDTSHILSYDKDADQEETDIVYPDNQGTETYGIDNNNDKKKLEWSFEKLKYAIQTFVKGSCQVLGMPTASSPLILHLDDLQWADADSIQIITALVTSCDLKGLLFIGSYRDDNNELDDGDSPLKTCQNSIQEAMADKVLKIKLSNLTRDSIDCLVADITRMSPACAEPLGELIYATSLGNAFFAIRLLRHLHESNLLLYCNSIQRWKWDAAKIYQELRMSNNVMDFMRRTLKSLPSSTTTALHIAACLGSQVDILLLQHLVQGFEIDVNIHPLKEVLQFAVSAHLIVMDSSETWFKFFHDRIQDAAYSLAETETQRQSMHLRIGRQLQGMKIEQESDLRQWTVVLAVDQLNHARDLLDNLQKVELARLNLIAAEEVISTSAFKMAEGFLDTGIEVLGMNRWSKQYDLTLDLSNKLAFVLFSNGSMEMSLSLIEQIYQQAKCNDDRQEVQFLHVEVLASLNRLSECIDTSMIILSQIGHRKLPKNPGSVHMISGIAGVKKLLKNKTDADLLTLPVCKDKKILSIIRHRKCVLQLNC
jgi:predicted ATPase